MIGKALNEQHFVIAGQVMDILRATPSGVGNEEIRRGISIGTMDVPTFMENAAGASDATNYDFENIGAVSLDGLFAPYTNAYSHDRLPHFEEPSGGYKITAKELDPFNPNNQLGSGNFLDDGHNITMAMHGGSGDVGVSGDLAFDKDYNERDEVTTSGVRSIARRCPEILTGYGFTTQGKPIPHATGDTDNFHPEAFWNPEHWKTGPIDWRWDDRRKVWLTGTNLSISLCKVTNTYNPSCFSYDVERSKTMSQYKRHNLTAKVYNSGNFPENIITDPEKEAYNNNSDNSGCYERLDYSGIEYPYYEAFIIRETQDQASSNPYYNIWTQDCQDCGHITNECGPGSGDASNKKILIENPLRESLEPGQLIFSVDTGRTKKVNTGSFTGGSGIGGDISLVSDTGGTLIASIVSSGTNYTSGAFAVISGVCGVSLSLTDNGNNLTGVNIVGTSSGYPANQTYGVTIYPTNVEVLSEDLPLHWILRKEPKVITNVSYVGCEGGILQTCSSKIEVGYSTCEHCGEDSTLINNWI